MLPVVFRWVRSIDGMVLPVVPGATLAPGEQVVGVTTVADRDSVDAMLDTVDEMLAEGTRTGGH